MSLGRLLPFGFVVLFLFLIQFSVAEDSTTMAMATGGQARKDYSKLNNVDGLTPCQMQEMLEGCSPSRFARNFVPFTSRTVPVPVQNSSLRLRRAVPNASRCTCTNVYLNLWNACFLTSEQEGTLPQSSRNWTDACQQQGLSFDAVSTSGGQSMSTRTQGIPAWAFNDLSTNQTFDIDQALDVAQQQDSSSKHSWTAVQIVTPIIAGLAVAMAIGIYWYLRRSKARQDKQKLGGAFRRLFRPCFGTRKVRTADRDNAWVIDHHEHSSDGDVDVDVDLDGSSSQKTQRSRYGHIRLSSSTGSVSDFHNQKPNAGATWAIPGKNLWKKSQLVQKARRTLLLLPVPWGNNLVSVTSTNPSRKFEIDASNKSTKTNSTLVNWRRGGFRYTGTSSGTTSESGNGTSRWDYEPQDTIFEDGEEEDEDGFDSGIGIGIGVGIGDERMRFDEEQESLIPPQEPIRSSSFDDVLLITNSGPDFSVESHNNNDSPVSTRHRLEVEVEPPTPAEVRPTTPQAVPVPPNPLHSLHHSRAGSQTRLHPPPAPNYPAPMPPATPPRSPPRLNRDLRKPSIETILASPSPSAFSSSASPSLVSTSLPQSTHHLPLHAIPPPPPPVLPTPTRRPSDEALYLPSSPPQSTPRSHAAASLRPMASMDSVIQPLRPPAQVPPVPPVTQRSPRDRDHHFGHHTHTRNDSYTTTTTTSLSLPLISSPPYRSSPLPDEIRIARSPSPPPNVSPFVTPPYSSFPRELPPTATAGRGRTPSPLPQPPPHHHYDNQHHRRIFSDDSISITAAAAAAAQDGPGDAGTHALMFDGYATGTAGTGIQQQQLNHNRDHTRNRSGGESMIPGREDTAMLFPGAVRAAGYMSPPPGNVRQLELPYEPEDLA